MEQIKQQRGINTKISTSSAARIPMRKSDLRDYFQEKYHSKQTSMIQTPIMYLDKGDGKGIESASQPAQRRYKKRKRGGDYSQIQMKTDRSNKQLISDIKIPELQNNYSTKGQALSHQALPQIKKMQPKLSDFD